MKALSLLAVLTAGLPSAAAETSRPPEQESGFLMALRAGYAIPLGKFATTNTGSSGSLSDEFNGMIPIWIDLGYRFNTNFIIAGFLQLGFPMVNENGPGLAGQECHINGVTSCSGTASVRLGLELIYVFKRDVSFQPWVGIGVAYERTTYKLEDNQGGEATIGYHGWEFVNFQIGGTYKITPKFGLGPYVALSLGQYGSVEASSGSQSQSVDIAQKGLHEWLQFGLMGSFDF